MRLLSTLTRLPPLLSLLSPPPLAVELAIVFVLVGLKLGFLASLAGVSTLIMLIPVQASAALGAVGLAPCVPRPAPPCPAPPAQTSACRKRRSSPHSLAGCLRGPGSC